MDKKPDSKRQIYKPSKRQTPEQKSDVKSTFSNIFGDVADSAKAQFSKSFNTLQKENSKLSEALKKKYHMDAEQIFQENLKWLETETKKRQAHMKRLNKSQDTLYANLNRMIARLDANLERSFRELQKANEEQNKHFKQMNEEQDKMIQKSHNFGSSLIDIINAFNLSALRSKAEDDMESIIKKSRDAHKKYNITTFYEDVYAVTNKINKDIGRSLTNADKVGQVMDALLDSGMKWGDRMKGVTESVIKDTRYLGLSDPSKMLGIATTLDKYAVMQGENLQRYLDKTSELMLNTTQTTGIGMEELSNSFSTLVQNGILAQAKNEKDAELISKNVLAAIGGLKQVGYNPDELAGILTQEKFSTFANLAERYGIAGIDVEKLQYLRDTGQYDELLPLLIGGMRDTLAQGDEVSRIMKEQMGISDSMANTILSNKNLTHKDLRDIVKTTKFGITKAKNDINKTLNDGSKTSASMFERIRNWWGSSAFYKYLGKFIGDLEINYSDAVLTGQLVTQAALLVTSNEWLKNIFKKMLAIEAFTKLAGGASLLGKGAAGKALGGAKTAKGWLGAKITSKAFMKRVSLQKRLERRMFKEFKTGWDMVIKAVLKIKDGLFALGKLLFVNPFTKLVGKGVAGLGNTLLRKPILNIVEGIFPKAFSKLNIGKGLGSIGKLGKAWKFLKGGGVLSALFGAYELGTAKKEERGDIMTSILGGLGGATAGAAIGSVIPVVGTIIGGFIGAILGDEALHYAAEKLPFLGDALKWLGEAAGDAIDIVKDLCSWLGDGFSLVFTKIKDWFNELTDSKFFHIIADLFKTDTSGSGNQPADDHRTGLGRWYTWATGRSLDKPSTDKQALTGEWMVPRDGMVYTLHAGEMVVPRQQADLVRRMFKNNYSGGFLSTLFKNIFGKGGSLNVSSYGGMGGYFGGSDIDAKDTTGRKGAVMDFLMSSMGLSKLDAAAITGNIQQESNFSTSAISFDGNGSIGLAQWTFDRRSALEDFAASMGQDVTDFNTQLLFLQKEITENYGHALQALKNATTLEEKTVAWGRTFEVPSEEYADWGARIAYSEDAFNSYKQGTPFVPNNQWAFLHKGEAVIPKEYNPANNLSSFDIADYSPITQVLTWGFEYLAKKIEDLDIRVNQVADTESTQPARVPTETSEEKLFRLTGMETYL